MRHAVELAPRVVADILLDEPARAAPAPRLERTAVVLAHAGIAVSIDAKHKIAHNKIMVIDGGTVITGSFNFTKSAEEGNAENLLFIRDTDLAAKYIENLKKHSEHSEEYKGK